MLRCRSSADRGKIAIKRMRRSPSAGDGNRNPRFSKDAKQGKYDMQSGPGHKERLCRQPQGRFPRSVEGVCGSLFSSGIRVRNGGGIG